MPLFYGTINHINISCHKQSLIFTIFTMWVTSVKYCASLRVIQSDQKVSVHLMISIQKVTSNVQNVLRQFPDIYWHAELCSRRPCSVKHGLHSEYILWWNCLKCCIFCVFFFLYCNRQVHRDFLITVYNSSLLTGILFQFLQYLTDSTKTMVNPQNTIALTL